MSRLEERIRIGRDGRITAFSGKVEYGQGIRGAFARMIAEELAVEPEQVDVVLGDTNQVPADMGTFGSLSVRTDGALLARAAAMAREELIRRAALQWSADAATLTAAGGRVHHPDGRSTSYGELATPSPAGPIPEVAWTAPAHRTVLDAVTERPDARAIVTGRARFVGDAHAGVLRGRAIHPPVPGARLVGIDQAAARAVPGVVAVVHEGDFAGVVAENAAAAHVGAVALNPRWDAPVASPGIGHSLVLRDDPGTSAALATPGLTLDAEYVVPAVANAPIGTSAAWASVTAEATEVRAGTQRPFGLREDAARLLGISPERVRVIAERSAGSYGRNNAGDAAIEAVRLSRAVARPVLVVWSRTDEFRASPSRPQLTAHVRAALGADRRITAWSSQITTHPHTYQGTGAGLPDAVVAMTSGRNAVPSYRIPAARVELHIAPSPIRSGALRSLAAAPNVFAIESAIDELALAAGADPIEFRLGHLDEPRLRRVLEAVRGLSGWDSRPRGQGRGYGVACAIYHGTCIAEVADVAVEDNGEVRLVKAYCAVDCGTVVDPDGARNQIEGGIIQGASWALLEDLYHDAAGHITAAAWQDYRILRFRDVPETISVTFTDDGQTPPTGLGEPGVVPIGAAIANGVAAACGVRMRRLPLASGQSSR